MRFLFFIQGYTRIIANYPVFKAELQIPLSGVKQAPVCKTHNRSNNNIN